MNSSRCGWFQESTGFKALKLIAGRARIFPKPRKATLHHIGGRCAQCELHVLALLGWLHWRADPHSPSVNPGTPVSNLKRDCRPQVPLARSRASVLAQLIMVGGSGPDRPASGWHRPRSSLLRVAVRVTARCGALARRSDSDVFPTSFQNRIKTKSILSEPHTAGLRGSLRGVDADRGGLQPADGVR
jgi:hypothetical protein